MQSQIPLPPKRPWLRGCPGSVPCTPRLSSAAGGSRHGDVPAPVPGWEDALLRQATREPWCSGTPEAVNVIT